MKYPIGIQTFSQIREDGYVYVDKTDLVYSLATEGKIYFLSRPRRFGKSLLVSTLESYYLGRRELFRGLKIDSLETEWKEYPVFRLDFNGQNFLNVGTLEESLDGQLSGWEERYGVTRRYEDFGLRFAAVLERAYRETGRRCVVLVDEYDKPLLDVMDTDVTVPREGGSAVSLEEHNRDILKGFYSTFKAADESLQFVLLTGVTKFSQVSVFSGFNQPKDISMSPKYESLCGITEEEMVEVFREPIAEMADRFGCGFGEMVATLKKRYDGYHFSKNMEGIFNPFSLLNAFDQLDVQDYWFRTGTPTYLIRLLRHFDENLDELTGRYYTTDQFVDYKADSERPLPMIYQSGYLTIKDFRQRTNTFLLDFPNDEVKRGFTSLLANNYLKGREDVNSWLVNAVDDLYDGHLDAFRDRLTSFFASIPYEMRRKDSEREKERYFHYTFYLLLRLASTYVTYTEKRQSQGRVDCVIETDGYVYIFEFKLDGTAAEALAQIEEKGYAQEYATDPRRLYKIGVDFSSEAGTIDGWQVAER